MSFELQPQLDNEIVKLAPLKEDDFESLYAVASDPLIWEQHPNKERYKREVFENFFKGAMESGGAFMIYDNVTGKPIGSSRYYGYEEDSGTVSVGYTFLAKDQWGSKYNFAVKRLMLDHAFRYVSKVLFHIGAGNIRSQKAIEKLGAMKCGEQDIKYYGEEDSRNFIYEMTKQDWEDLREKF
jgi:RimJ/RimL family protein N-acetyltransferase